MSQDEITVIEGGKCIYQLRGVRPFLSDKFDITKHKSIVFLNLFISPDDSSFMEKNMMVVHPTMMIGQL